MTVGRSAEADLDAADTMGPAMAQLIDELFPLRRVRELAESPSQLDPVYLRRAAALGCFRLFDSRHDGTRTFARAITDGVAAATERGRILQPLPFVATNVVVHALDVGGSAEQRETVLPALAGGGAVATWAAADASGRWSPDRGLEAVRSGRGFVLDGIRGLVQDAHLADWILVAADTGVGAAQLLVPTGHPGVTVNVLEGLDLTRTFCEVRFDGAELPASALVGDWEAPNEMLDGELDIAVVLALAETIGAMAALFETTLAYAKARTAFGRPIGSFQAVKHQLVDTSLVLETSRALLEAATRAVGGRLPEASEVASIAKSYVSDAAVALGHACWQTFGGVAYTWGHDFHLYLRRLTTDAALFGDAGWHNERIWARHGA